MLRRAGGCGQLRIERRHADVGAAVVAFFSGVTVWSMLFTIGKSAATTGAVVMGSWLAKMIVLRELQNISFNSYSKWRCPV